MKFRSYLAAASLLGTLACSSDDDNATISVLLESEDVIINGLEAGDDFHDIQDGWAVDFDKYIVAVGAIELHGDSEAHADDIFAIDLTTVSEGGDELWKIEGLAEGDYEFNYSTLPDGATRHESVSEEDFQTMVDGDLTYLISATMTNDDGVSCPPADLADVPNSAEEAGENEAGVMCYTAPQIDFNIGLESEVVYGPCEIDGIPGVKATSGSTTTVAVTIHGDHLFFNGFPEGDEGGVTRLAQWWADCDLNLDGEVTQEELEAVAPSDLSEIDDRFQIGAAEFENMWEYLEAQVATQGHFQGEGECPANGESHDHGHSHD